MPKYHYRPKGNRTPVTHPVFGHLEWDGEYDNPECANDPNFVEIREKQDDPEADAAEESAPAPEPVTPDPVTKSHASSAAKAGKPGRS